MENRDVENGDGPLFPSSAVSMTAVKCAMRVNSVAFALGGASACGVRRLPLYLLPNRVGASAGCVKTACTFERRVLAVLGQNGFRASALAFRVVISLRRVFPDPDVDALLDRGRQKRRAQVYDSPAADFVGDAFVRHDVRLMEPALYGEIARALAFRVSRSTCAEPERQGENGDGGYPSFRHMRDCPIQNGRDIANEM
jgi:hypothetical protein